MGAASPKTPVGVMMISRVARAMIVPALNAFGLNPGHRVGRRLVPNQFEDVERRHQVAARRVQFEDHGITARFLGCFLKSSFDASCRHAVDWAVDGDHGDRLRLPARGDRSQVSWLTGAGVSGPERQCRSAT